MSADPVVCTTDVEEAKELADDLIQVVIARDTNIATLFTTLAIITGDSIWQLERKGVTVTMDIAFSEMRRVAEMQLEYSRRRALAQALDCAGSA